MVGDLELHYLALLKCVMINRDTRFVIDVQVTQELRLSVKVAAATEKLSCKNSKEPKNDLYKNQYTGSA